MAEKNISFEDKLEELFNKINALTKIQKIGVFVGTIVLIFGLYGWLFYLPAQDEIDRLSKKDEELVRKVAIARKKASMLEKIRADLDKRKEEYLFVMKALPDTKEIPGILSSLSASAKESGLQLSKIVPKAEKVKGFYSEIPLSINIYGRYHQVAAFFDKVSRLGRIVSINSVNMELKEKNELQVSCDAVTYRFLKTQPKKKKK